jgi:hypothetical protein
MIVGMGDGREKGAEVKVKGSRGVRDAGSEGESWKAEGGKTNSECGGC